MQDNKNGVHKNVLGGREYFDTNVRETSVFYGSAGATYPVENQQKANNISRETGRKSHVFL